MKKKIFFILILILIIIIFSYNNYYEHFSFKVQDAMIFKDYQNKLVGTYPDINLYPDLFTKLKGEYVNMIGTVHDVSEIKMPKPKDGKEGPIGGKGKQGDRGSQGPRGKHGEELIDEDVVNNINSRCIATGGILNSRMCIGLTGLSPSSPPNGTPGQICPHAGGTFIEEDGHQVYYNGQCPQGEQGDNGKSCEEEHGHTGGICPAGATGDPGLTCEKVNSDANIVVLKDDNGVMRKCPPGKKGDSGKKCTTECLVPRDANNGKTCYDLYSKYMPACDTNPGKDCMNRHTPNVKTCRVINPDKPSDVANNLSINGYNGNTLTINNNNNNAIRFKGKGIKLPTNGNIVLKDANNNTIETINQSYIVNMISKSKQCKKCPVKNAKLRWNNSINCEKDQGECKNCTECKSGEYVEKACSEHADTVCNKCDPGYVGIGCSTLCNDNEIPNSDLSACVEIPYNNYINTNDVIIDVPDGYYRHLTDARVINECPKGHYCINGVKNECPTGKYQNSTGQTSCKSCKSLCPGGEELSGSCPMGSISDTKTCSKCPAGKYKSGTNNNSCSKCPAGKYQNSTGQTTCKSCKSSCPEGKELSGTCPLGSTRDAKTCSKCPAGKYKTGTNSNSCLSCPEGEYQNSTGQTSCKYCVNLCDDNKYLSGSCPSGSTSDDTSCNDCPGGYYCNGRNKYECTSCNGNQYRYSNCTATSNAQCANYGSWITLNGSKIDYGAPGRADTWAVCTAGGGYEYSLIFWGEKLICATMQVSGTITHQSSSNGVFQFMKGGEYDNGDDIHLKWAYESKHSSFANYNGMIFGNHDHWNVAVCYHLKYRFAGW